MIPQAHLPGFTQWGRALDELLNRAEVLWIHGESGCGASTLGASLAVRRGVDFLDDADRLAPEEVAAWMRAHPGGVLAAHQPPNLDLNWNLLELRLPTFREDPESIAACLRVLAQEEGLTGALPPSLGRLPCPGNLRGLRNRVVRWKLLGQLPEDSSVDGGGTALPLESDDLATNLHVLEKLLLHRALRRSYGNRVEAARRLGVSRRQLYLLVARHGDPVRGEAPTSEGPKRLGKARKRQNSSPEPEHR